MTPNADKIDDAVLALLQLTSFTEGGVAGGAARAGRLLLFHFQSRAKGRLHWVTGPTSASACSCRQGWRRSRRPSLGERGQE